MLAFQKIRLRVFGDGSIWRFYANGQMLGVFYPEQELLVLDTKKQEKSSLEAAVRKIVRHQKQRARREG